jgi:hypothetical protein
MLWEYKVAIHRVMIRMPDADSGEDASITALLDRYGSAGWELVSVISQTYRREYDPPSLYGQCVLQFYLKRAKS